MKTTSAHQTETGTVYERPQPAAVCALLYSDVPSHPSDCVCVVFVAGSAGVPDPCLLLRHVLLCGRVAHAGPQHAAAGLPRLEVGDAPVLAGAVATSCTLRVRVFTAYLTWIPV